MGCLMGWELSIRHLVGDREEDGYVVSYKKSFGLLMPTVSDYDKESSY